MKFCQGGPTRQNVLMHVPGGRIRVILLHSSEYLPVFGKRLAQAAGQIQ